MQSADWDGGGVDKGVINDIAGGAKDLCSICQKINFWKVPGEPASSTIYTWRGPLSHVLNCHSCVLCKYVREHTETSVFLERKEILEANWQIKTRSRYMGMLSRSFKVGSFCQIAMSIEFVGSPYAQCGWIPLCQLDVCTEPPGRSWQEYEYQLLRLPIANQFKIDQLRRWLADSDAGEEQYVKRRERSFEEFRALIDERRFRVVDTQSGEIIEATEMVSYVAVSYVWGKKERATNAFVLAHDDGKRMVDFQNTPATLRDAIHLVSQLNLQYIWIDQLCVTQDDPDDKVANIRKMGVIYSMATFTLVAATGFDAEAGLTRLHNRQRPHEMELTAKHQGKSISFLPERETIDQIVQGTTWAKRGWTFQEQCLSTRRIIFTDEEVFYQDGIREEREAYKLVKTRPDSPEREKITMPKAWTFQSYFARMHASETPTALVLRYSLAETISLYIKRDLTIEGDRLSAFLGVLMCFRPRDISSNVMQMLSGLDPVHPSSGLCFSTVGDYIRNYQPGTRKVSSWSWAGWNGRITPRALAWPETGTTSRANRIDDNNLQLESSDAIWPFEPSAVIRAPTESIVLHLYVKATRWSPPVNQPTCEGKLLESCICTICHDRVQAVEASYLLIFPLLPCEAFLICIETEHDGLFERVTFVDYHSSIPREHRECVLQPEGLKFHHVRLV